MNTPDPAPNYYSRKQIQIMFAVLASLIVMLGVFVLAKTTALGVELAARPPVAVLHVDASILEALSKGGSGSTSVDAEIARVRATGEKLAKAGYLVLDAKTVYAFPADYEVEMQ